MIQSGSQKKSVSAEISEDEKSFIISVLENDYAGIQDMRDSGFTAQMITECRTIQNLFDLFEAYVRHDMHFQCAVRGVCWSPDVRVDEKCRKSADAPGTYFEKATSNCYYIRFCDCNAEEGSPYATEFVNAALRARNHDFIVLDARSNSGGSNLEQVKFFDDLLAFGYGGTILVLQDKFSYSSGEVWAIAGRYARQLDITLVGTYSGGCQSYGNTRKKASGTVQMLVAGAKMQIPDDGKFKGEGIGYKPDIFACTEEMPLALKNLGVDVNGIQFR